MIMIIKLELKQIYCSFLCTQFRMVIIFEVNVCTEQKQAYWYRFFYYKFPLP